ncbi:MAG: alpha/beta hydrolase [Planctomycetes bacterium]|nr:alpha/beta hydrolase [Planctomycetota bacterium]
MAEVKLTNVQLILYGLLAGAAGGAVAAGLTLGLRPAPAPGPASTASPAEAPDPGGPPSVESPAPEPAPAAAAPAPAAAPTLAAEPPPAERLRALEAFLVRYRSPSRSNVDHAERIALPAARWTWYVRSVREGDVVALLRALELARAPDGGAPPEDPREEATHAWLSLWAAFREPADLDVLVARARQGEPLALVYLAHLRAWDLVPATTDPIEGLVAAAQGDPRAMHALAALSQARSPRRLQWLEKAATAGHALAVYELIAELDSTNPVEALRWGLRAHEELGQPLDSRLLHAASRLARSGKEPDVVGRALDAFVAMSDGRSGHEARVARAYFRAVRGERAGAVADLATVLAHTQRRGEEHHARQARAAAAELQVTDEELEAAPVEAPAAARGAPERPPPYVAPRDDGPDPAPADELARVDAGGEEPAEVRFTSADGFELHGDLWRDDGARLVVVLLHQTGADRTSWRPLARALHAAGASVLAFDRRGQGRSTRRGGEEEAAGAAPGQRMREESLDVAAALAHLEQAGVPRRRVVLGGAGSGASAALLAAPSVPGLEALLLLSPHAAYHGVDVRPALSALTVPFLAYAAEEDPGLKRGLEALFAVKAGAGGLIVKRGGDAHGTRLLTAAGERRGRTLVGGPRMGIDLLNLPELDAPLTGVEAFLRVVLGR